MLRRWITMMLLLGIAAGLAFAEGAKVGGEARQLAMGASQGLIGKAKKIIARRPIRCAAQLCS